LAVYFWEKGVAHEITARYSPEQNGVAERLNWVLMEKARAMLVESGLPDEMWAEAVMTANYTRNRTPVTAHGKTPWEAFHRKKPNVSHLRVFGAPVYMHVSKELRDKLESVSEKGRFLGYEPDAKAYRILRERDNWVIVSRDVIVDEQLTVAEKPGVEIDMGMEEDAAEAFLPAAQRRVRRVKMEPQSDVPENPHGEIVGVEAAAEDVGGQLENEEQRGVRRNPVRERRKSGEWYRANLASSKDGAYAPDPMTYKEAIAGADADLWRKAMNEEMTSLLENGTWELGKLPKGAKALPMKWVYKIKRDAQGNVERHKARFVAKGYLQREGIDFEEVYAPSAGVLARYMATPTEDH
jgi:hypothetical protein